MGSQHGGPVVQKSIPEIGAFLKQMVPARIPDLWTLKPRFRNMACARDIPEGIIAYRDFLYCLCDRLIQEGEEYFSLKKKPSSPTDYPLLIILTDLLCDIGYYGELKPGEQTLLVDRLPSFLPSAEEGRGKPRNSAVKLKAALRFLEICGFEFYPMDLSAKRPVLFQGYPLEVRYPDAPLLPVGLKVLSVADKELRERRYKTDLNRDNLLRCDYSLLISEEADLALSLDQFAQSFSEELRTLIITLHRRFTEQGMTCAALCSTFESHFAYADLRKSRNDLSKKEIYQKRKWEFALDTRHGYCLVVRAEKTERYSEAIEAFPPVLREKIKRGYGCDRKLRDEPCQRGCQGIRLPLDDSILRMGTAIETWLDKECWS